MPMIKVMSQYSAYNARGSMIVRTVMEKAVQSVTTSVGASIAAAFFVVVSSAAVARPQSTAPTMPSPSPPSSSGSQKDEQPLTSFEEEIKAKRAIKMAEKDHQENVNRAKEVAELAKDVEAALKNKTTIDRESSKKLDRIEKLTKKIRNEAGGEDEEVEIVDRPSDIGGAVKQICESAESLSKIVQNTPRQVVSASVIGNANVLLELIKLLRTFDTRP